MQISSINSQLNDIINENEENKGIISVWGDVGVGKTTLCLTFALSKLAMGKKVIYIYTKPEFNKERFFQLKSAYKNFDLFNFILYTPKSVSELLDVIMSLEFLILEEKRLTGHSTIGLIVLDTCSTLFQLKIGSDHNQEMDTKLGMILATLDFLITNYNIPAVITSRMVSKFSDSENIYIEYPAAEKVVNTFAFFSIKIERTEQVGYRELIIEKKNSEQSFIQHIRCKVKLSQFGFE